MPTIERLLLAYVVNAAWTTCVVAAVAALLSRWTRQGPSVNRHILWVVALALASLLPLATLRNSTGRNLAASSSARGEMNASPSTGRPSSSLHSVWFVMRHGGALIPTAPFSAGLLSTFYVAFLCYRGTRLWWLWRRTKQILRRASSCAIPSSTAAVVQRCCAAFGVARVTILTSGEIAGPVALGVRHPILVFPEWFFSKVTEEEVVCSMCHELAHVCRKDFLLNLVYEVLSLPVSFHPAMAFIKARVGRSRELACDEVAASKVSARGTYARSLVRIAGFVASAASRSKLALGLFETNSLGERVVNLLGETRPGHKRPARMQAVVASSLLAATCLLTTPFSIRVAAADPEGKLEYFAGKWEAQFEGRTFLTVELNTESDKLTGTITRTSFHLNPAGELVYAQQQNESDAASEAKLMDGVLVLATGKNGLLNTAGGTEGVPIPVRYKMRIVGSNQAELRIDGVPSGIPVPKPWKLKREPVNP